MKYVGGALMLLQLVFLFIWAFKHGLRSGFVMIATLVYLFAILYSTKFMNGLSDSTNFILLGAGLGGLILLVILFVVVFNLDAKAKRR